jgi:short-subunit dehydrogenase
MSVTRPFAILTGASTDIGFELAKRCAKEGYDLLIAADEPTIEQAATSLRGVGTEVASIARWRNPVLQKMSKPAEWSERPCASAGFHLN